MACCSLPETRQTLDELILRGDTFGEDDDDSSSSSRNSSADQDDLFVNSTTRQPLSPSLLNTLNDTKTIPSPANPVTNVLPSPTGAPSRRELDRWDPSYITTCCLSSYAGSTATTASIRSEEEEYFPLDVSREEIRSNATTQVVSHRNKNNRRNHLLTTTLATAEQRLRAQLHAEEERAKEIWALRQQETNR
jgi:hypothetical protein